MHIMKQMTHTISAILISVVCLCFLIPLHAYCEKGCSGHGICGDYDLCKCFHGKNGEPVWTGPDCSLRTCPK
jgi:hypothetical protein